MTCVICNRKAQLQMPLSISGEGFVTGDLGFDLGFVIDDIALKEFCYVCMYQISIAYNNVRLRIPSENLKQLDGEQ